MFDPGSTHSYVSPYFATQFGKQPVLLDHPFHVSTPVGDSLLVEYVFKSYLITVDGRETVADLIVLDMLDFDVILGMDWLASCHATLDCHAKVVRFNVPNESSFFVRGDRRLVSITLVSFLSVRRLLSKGC